MEPKVSERFPAEYGDISLQSCDGVICHFPKSVLSYASKHFRGIFHPLPSADQDDLFRRVTLVVTEKAEILEAFLDLIDPSTVSPQMSARTVRDIVEAARKYDVPVIFHWFQREVNLRYYDLSSHQTTEPFLLSNPLMALSIAVEHNLEKIGKMAVTELLGCTSEHVDIANVGVPVEIRDRIREFRNERVKVYMVWIRILAKGERAPPNRFYTTRFYHAKTCLPCSLLRMEWTLGLITKVQDSPRWSTFQECIEQPGCNKSACSDHQTDWSSYTRNIAAGLQQSLKSQEEEEAVWPFR